MFGVSKRQPRWWESGFNLGFGGTVIAGVAAGVIADWLGWAPVGSWVATGFRWLVRPVGVPFIVLAAVSLFVAAVGLRWLRSLQQPPPPPWLTYREDNFLGAVWRWRYAGNYVMEESLRPYCPQCQTALRIEDGGYRGMTTILVCDECSFSKELEGSHQKVIERIGRLIERAANLRARRASEPRTSA